MRFSWDFLQNMLENGHSNMQAKLMSAYHFKYFQNIQFKNHGIAPTPRPPNFETLPYPRCRWKVRNFFAKMKGKDELEGTRSNSTPWLCDFEYQGENR